MTSHQELAALVFLNRLGGRNLSSLIQEGMAATEILGRIAEENFLGRQCAFHKLAGQFDSEKEIEDCEKKNIRLISFSDSDYPSLLKQISHPPVLLYVQGNFHEADEAAIAVVGSRHPNLYGLSHARAFSRELANYGLTIVSGLAQGVDQAAHEAALEISYGRTIAILGCGVDVFYPSNSKKLRERILERGAIISEYALGTPPLAENFPRRNRIIAGLSQGVLVVQAHSRSGSLITAREAAEQGREVFAIPGPIDLLGSRGTHSLIKDGATLVESPLEIIEYLQPSLWPLVPRLQQQQQQPLIEAATEHYEEEHQKVMRLLAAGPLASDEIAGQCLLTPASTAIVLTELELKRKIRKSPDGRFAALN